MKLLRRALCALVGHEEDVLEPKCIRCEAPIDQTVLDERKIAWDDLLASPLNFARAGAREVGRRLPAAPPAPNSWQRGAAAYNSI